ncbi:Unknown protein [Striga hermonthica]|uniref:Transmembrane protein n=1 Tax=Striga hermonthica TaxID=68872 RepID=A0A9N7REP9_STRHE|nr:Unknown protein [Striga hermonthica]
MASSEGFPAVDAQKELNPGIDKDFQVDSVSSNVAATKEIEDQINEAKKLDERKRKEAVQSFKTALIVSGIVVAVAGAVFAIARKMRERNDA